MSKPILKSDDNLRGRISSGTNYDRLVRQRRYDPMAQQFDDGAWLEARILRLREQIERHEAANSDLRTKGYARLLRQYNQVMNQKRAVDRALMAHGEPKAPAKIVAEAGAVRVQVEFPWEQVAEAVSDGG